MTYLQSNVFRYHDTFPRPEWVPAWPQTIPMPSAEELWQGIGQPGSVMGDPDQALKGCSGMGRRRGRSACVRDGLQRAGRRPQDH